MRGRRESARDGLKDLVETARCPTSVNELSQICLRQTSAPEARTYASREVGTVRPIGRTTAEGDCGRMMVSKRSQVGRNRTHPLRLPWPPSHDRTSALVQVDHLDISPLLGCGYVQAVRIRSSVPRSSSRITHRARGRRKSGKARPTDEEDDGTKAQLWGPVAMLGRYKRVC